MRRAPGGGGGQRLLRAGAVDALLQAVSQARTTEGAKAWLEVLQELIEGRGDGGESGAAGEKGGGKKNEPPAVGPPPWCWKQRRSALMLPPGGDRAISGDLAPGSDA